MRGVVAGSAASIRDALDLLDNREVDGAILDVNLIDGEVTPVVESLLARGISVIIQTGVGLPAALEGLEAPPPVLLKPVFPDRLLQKLAEQLNKR